MPKTESRLNTWLPIVLTASFLLLLPFSRLSEIPFSLLALTAPWLLWKRHELRTSKSMLTLLLCLWLAFWLPMLISSLDSYAMQKSWLQTLAAIRFPLFAVSAALLIKTARQHHLLLGILATIIGFWVIDGLVQALAGNSLFGFAANNQRLGGIFGTHIWFFGPILAMLSPLLLEWLWQRQPRLWFALALLATILVVLLAGMRAGWLLLPLLLLVYGWRYLREQRHGQWRRLLVTGSIMAAILLFAASQSEIVQQRWHNSLAVLQPDTRSLQLATTQRWMIWQTAVRMLTAHPLNGVGVRAFPVAYPDFASADDPQLHLRNGQPAGSRHVHNLWLEALTDCGLIGLAGLLMFTLLLLKLWRQADARARQRALPYGFALLLILFPFNTHYSLYGTFLSSLIWWLLALLLSATQAKQ